MHVTVMTPTEKVVDSDNAEHVILPAANGEVGVLPGHNPMVCSLTDGRLRVELADEHVELRTRGGFAEVSGDRVTVLVDAVERNEDG
jgi:F-type H+-transporting ATPase subunit epsilon